MKHGFAKNFFADEDNFRPYQQPSFGWVTESARRFNQYRIQTFAGLAKQRRVWF
jgi:hypothetical protein